MLVEPIGVNGKTDPFPARPWSLDWMREHCRSRYAALDDLAAVAGCWWWLAVEWPAALSCRIERRLAVLCCAGLG